MSTAIRLTGRVRVVIAAPAIKVKVGKVKLLMTGEEALVVYKQRRRRRRLLLIEVAKSGRSKCKACRQLIHKGSHRAGVITFIPHRNVKWYHLSKECVGRLTLSLILEKSIGWEDLPDGQKELAQICWLKGGLKVPSLYGATGQLDMPRLAIALTGRYDRFRSFRFALPEAERYSPNWNWRCLLATMLVCNTREETMLRVTDRLFKEFPDQDSLLSLYDNPGRREFWKDYMIQEDLKHAKRKMGNILYATKIIKEKHQGEVPCSREALRAIPGVGAHVSSVTMAWVHEAPEFGIDVHVRRIMERWGMIAEKEKDYQVEIHVKKEVPSSQLGHFSRAFVDHGQSVCGYVPDCQNCYLRKCCPAAAKYMDW